MGHRLTAPDAPPGAPSSGADRRTVAVFCRSYLPQSETFVRDHLRSLRRYQPVVVANSLIAEGLVLDDVPVIVRRSNHSAHFVRRLSRRGHHPALRMAIDESKATLVHAHFGTAGVLVRDACRRLGLPLVVTFHGYDVTVRPVRHTRQEVGRRYGRQRQTLLREADAIITVSQYLAGRLAELGAEPSRIHVIPCGVDTTRFDATPVPGNRHVVFVGRLVEKKGCDDLLRALAQCARPATVTIIGDGPRRESLARLARELDVRADFLGAQPHERVRHEIRRAQVVALPSRTAANGDQEGLPVIALEAAACGRPVAGYRHSGIPEAVIDGHTGLLAVEGDIAGLAAALGALLDDPRRSQTMGALARDRATRLFDLSTTTARVEAVYDRVLTSASQHRSVPR